MQIIRRFLFLSSLLLTIGLTSISAFAAQKLPATVVDALNRSAIPLQAVGIYVQPVSGPVPMLSLNADAGFNPASTMKLVTSNAALDLLGPAFSWKTQIYANGTQDGDVLRGDLIIKGSGDPKLVTEKLWQLLRQVRAAGIREIRGNVILDRSLFATFLHDAAQFDDAPLKPYNAGPDALLLNYKALALRFRPDPMRLVADVQTDPPLAGFPINAPVLSNGACGDWQGRLNLQLDASGVRFDGAYPASCGEKTWYLHPYTISDADYFGRVFKELWSEVGGLFNGSVVEGTVPQDARVVSEWQSPSLPEVIRDINKYSNNVMARQLLLSIAAETGNVPATPAGGAALIKGWLDHKGIDTTKLVIENGSGLSRVEQVSAEMMGRMLVAAYQSPVMPELMSSLPVVGLDGTMRKRLVMDTIAGHAHIKTGSLDNVRAVAGYVLAASGRRYAVVCIINDLHAAGGQAAQDALLQWVYEKG